MLRIAAALRHKLCRSAAVGASQCGVCVSQCGVCVPQCGMRGAQCCAGAAPLRRDPDTVRRLTGPSDHLAAACRGC